MKIANASKSYNYNTLCNEKSSFSRYHAVILFTYFIIVSNGDLNSINNIEWLLFGLISLSLFIKLIQSPLVLGKYLAWFVLFTILNLISFFWAANTDYALMGIKVIINILPFSVYLYSLVKNKTDIELVVKLFILATLFNCIYVLLQTDISSSSVFRLANGMGGGWNPNVLGMQVAFAFCFCIWLFNEQFLKKGKKNMALLALSIFYILIVFLTGSKKALLIAALFPTLQYILFQRKNKMRYFLVTMIGFIIGYYLIFNLPFLYKSIGLRIDQFIYSLGQIHTGDRSGDLARLAMIELGWEQFLKRPLFGYGAWNYAYLNGMINSVHIYSHNNYIEMLVNYGVFGATLYYSAYFHLLRKSIRGLGNSFVFSIVTCLFIADIAFVSYYCFYYQMILIICFSLIKIDTNNMKSNNGLRSINLRH